MNNLSWLVFVLLSFSLVTKSACSQDQEYKESFLKKYILGERNYFELGFGVSGSSFDYHSRKGYRHYHFPWKGVKSELYSKRDMGFRRFFHLIPTSNFFPYLGNVTYTRIVKERYSVGAGQFLFSDLPISQSDPHVKEDIAIRGFIFRYGKIGMRLYKKRIWSLWSELLIGQRNTINNVVVASRLVRVLADGTPIYSSILRYEEFNNVFISPLIKGQFDFKRFPLTAGFRIIPVINIQPENQNTPRFNFNTAFSIGFRI